MDLIAAIKDHKEEIIEMLTAYPLIRTLYEWDLDRCLPLTPDDLTPDERQEVISLADELRTNGTIGQFVIDLCYSKHQLSTRERLAAICCWQLAIADPVQEWEAAVWRRPSIKSDLNAGSSRWWIVADCDATDVDDPPPPAVVARGRTA